MTWLGTPVVDLRPGMEPEFYGSVTPDEDGTYDLGQMGWCLVAVAR